MSYHQNKVDLQPGEAINYRLDGSLPDSEQILKFIETSTRAYALTPYVREFAIRLVAGLRDNDQIGQANRLIDFVRKNLTYVRDPVGAEYIVSPVRLLQEFERTGYMAGDCDDHVLLLNSLLGAVGIPTKAIGVKFGPTNRFNHVVSGIQLRGQLYLVDPCSKRLPQPEYKETLMI
jgi:transglutaminase-like putative cysteine protease